MVSDRCLRCRNQDKLSRGGLGLGNHQAGFRDGGSQALAQRAHLGVVSSYGPWQGRPPMVTISGLSEGFLK